MNPTVYDVCIKLNNAIQPSHIEHKSTFDILYYTNGKKYMLKYCQNNEICLSKNDLCHVSQVDGVVFVVPNGCLHHIILVSLEALHYEMNYLKMVRSKCFFQFEYVFYKERILYIGKCL